MGCYPLSKRKRPQRGQFIIDLGPFGVLISLLIYINTAPNPHHDGTRIAVKCLDSSLYTIIYKFIVPCKAAPHETSTTLLMESRSRNLDDRLDNRPFGPFLRWEVHRYTPS